MTKPHPCKILCVPINLYLKNVIGDLAETHKKAKLFRITQSKNYYTYEKKMK